MNPPEGIIARALLAAPAAAYVDLEADVTDKFTLQGAVRYEDFSEFGDTTDYKIAGMYHVTDSFRIRAAYSTGFHAPTAGQANITNVTTQNVAGVFRLIGHPVVLHVPEEVPHEGVDPP